jgi:hypothetical protein
MASRTLLYIPIVHSQPDMGELSDSIRKITLQKLGARVWHQKVHLINRFWSMVEDALNSLSIDYERTRLYQDGIPVCGKELDIVKELAGKGSLNHQLLVRLIEKGATIMGTESPDLLIEEYQLTHLILESGDLNEAIRVEAMQKAAGNLLLAKRDVFIAARIDQTLSTGETGVLFLGMLHDISALLPADVEVSYPMNRPLTALHEAVNPAKAGIRRKKND